MATQVTATVVGGMLRPDHALPLVDQTRVYLTIEPIVEGRGAVAAWESLKARLGRRPIHAAGERFTRHDLHERR